MDAAIHTKIEDFFQQHIAKEYQPGEILIRAEEKPSEIVYLQEGIVRQYCISPEGEELTVNLFKPVAFFPLMYVVNQTPNRYYFEALTQVKGWKAPNEAVIEFLKQNNDVMYDLIKRVYIGMDSLLARMEYIIAGNAKTKVLFTLLNAAYRFGSADSTGIHIALKMTHKDFAALSGIARETFSREIKKLEQQGLITIEEHVITVNDIDLLEQQLFES